MSILIQKWSVPLVTLLILLQFCAYSKGSESASQTQSIGTARKPISEDRLKLPEYFGVYVIKQSGEAVMLDKTSERLDEQPKFSVSADIEFLVYGNKIDPESIHLITMPEQKDTPVQTGPKENSLLMKPVSKEHQMLRLIPAATLPDGHYRVKVSGTWYSFVVGPNFQLADLYMQQRRFLDARKLIEQFLKEDPQHAKAAAFLMQVGRVEKADDRRKELESLFSKGSADINSALELADLYQQLGMEQQFQGLTQNILNDTNIPVNVYLAVAKICADGKKVDLLANALRRYVIRDPTNPKVWLDLAAAQAMLNHTNEAISSLKTSIDLGGEASRDVARSDQRFSNIKAMQGFQVLIANAP